MPGAKAFTSVGTYEALVRMAPDAPLVCIELLRGLPAGIWIECAPVQPEGGAVTLRRWLDVLERLGPDERESRGFAKSPRELPRAHPLAVALGRLQAIAGGPGAPAGDPRLQDVAALLEARIALRRWLPGDDPTAFSAAVQFMDLDAAVRGEAAQALARVRTDALANQNRARARGAAKIADRYAALAELTLDLARLLDPPQR